MNSNKALSRSLFMFYIFLLWHMHTSGWKSNLADTGALRIKNQESSLRRNMPLHIFVKE